MLNEQNLHGIYVPIVTPFLNNGELDYKSFEEHMGTLLTAGIHGLIINGTTGESPTVTMDEVKNCMRIAKKANEDYRIPIVIGTGTNDTAASIRRTELAGTNGADAALVVVPYYNRPSQEGIIEHYRQVTKVGVPIIAYDVPSRTGVGLTLESTKAILSIDGVIGLKDSSGKSITDRSGGMKIDRSGEIKTDSSGENKTDSSGDMKIDSSGDIKIKELVKYCGSKSILCGEDELFYSMLELGAKGGMLAAANVQTAKFVQLYTSYRNGDMQQAKQINDQLIPLIKLLFEESNPAPLKWLLAKQGAIATGTLRLPMTSISLQLQQRLEAYLS